MSIETYLIKFGCAIGLGFFMNYAGIELRDWRFWVVVVPVAIVLVVLGG